LSSASPLLLATAAAFGWALYDLARRSLAARLNAWSLVVGLTTGAVPPLAAWALWIGDWRIEAPYWVPSLASVALNVVANFCFFRSFQLAPLSVTLPMLSFTPLFASLLGALFLGETLGPAGAVGRGGSRSGSGRAGSRSRRGPS
jgi:drug/metabolite transporter (DMT)-like permease